MESSDLEPLITGTKNNAQRLQQSNDKLDRCIKTLNETESIGISTLASLNEQERTIINIKDNIDNSINPNIKKSNSVIVGMFRQFQKNKYVQYTTVLVCIAIIIMLFILIIVKKN